ncbi:MAG: nickel-dependent lactate racemase [Anaerolineae bacterium]
MPTYDLPYGRGSIPLNLSTHAHVEQILPSKAEAASDPEATVAEAVAHPVDGRPLSQYRGVRKVAIAINDKTRPVPHAVMLPPLLRGLESLGFGPEDVTLIIATGTHIPMPPETFYKVVPPEILARYPVISHDCDADDLVMLGTTVRGVPVRANRRYMEADLRIVVGNIEPHHFAGFSGGVKTAAIGLAGRETIAKNHSLLRDPRSVLARYDDNPLRQDIEEIGHRVDIHFALNVVMNDDKEIVAAFAGDPWSVIEVGIPWVRRIYEEPVHAPFDVMITCPGGYPKDINLYQSHKAVSCANRVTQEGGKIILVAACEDGVGSRGYVRYMARGFDSHEAVMAQFVREPFRIGPHKAYIFGRDAVRLDDILIVSEIDPAQIRQLLLTPASLEEAIASAIEPLGPSSRIGIMPYANATIPVLQPSSEQVDGL